MFLNFHQRKKQIGKLKKFLIKRILNSSTFNGIEMNCVKNDEKFITETMKQIPLFLLNSFT